MDMIHIMLYDYILIRWLFYWIILFFYGALNSQPLTLGKNYTGIIVGGNSYMNGKLYHPYNELNYLYNVKCVDVLLVAII